MKLRVLYVILFVILYCCKKDGEMPSESAPSDFIIELEQLDAEHTGIDFSNTLNDEGNLNVFVWNFLYTGAGVATGDINNDGLPDIYFAGNQVPDRLYINKGDFRFEDITQSAGIIADRTWSTGVTMADVNADGLLDIYVCKNSPTPNREANRNRLYINLGSNRFDEQAAQYGIADEGFSIQASFFDMDQDGDLDVYLINQPFDQLARFIHPPDVVEEYPSPDRLFINDGGRFIDRTAELRVTDDRYGLGISLGDFDGNGWTDIYLCNDYMHADFLFMNKEGALVDELNQRTGHTSFYSMGSDAGDLNNDGWEDIYVLDMAFEDHFRAKTNMESMQPELFWDIVAQGHQYPYAQNTLQFNRGDGYFSEIAQIGGLSKTDWSWATLLVDLDQDGFQDILVTNGILRDMKDNDFTMWVKEKYQGRVGPANYLDVLSHLPSNPVPNKIFRNIDGMRYEDVSDEVDFGGPGFSHGLAYADFDGDGDLDLVVNNMNAPAGIFRNSARHQGNWLRITLEGEGMNKNGLGISVMLCAGGSCTGRTMQTTRGYYSSSVPELHFGLGSMTSIDSLIIYWSADEMSVLRDLDVNREVQVSYASSAKIPRLKRSSDNGILSFKGELPHVHREEPFDDYARQVLLPYKLSQNGPFIATGDVNADGYIDLFIGGAAGQPGAILKQNADGTFTATTQLSLEGDKAYEDMEAVFFDADADQDLDLYIVSGSNEFAERDPLLEDRMYLNDGSGTFTRHAEALPALRINGQCVEALDIDGDGDLDLFVGGRLKSDAYPMPVSSALLLNEGGIFKDVTHDVAPFLADMGLVTDAIHDDVDGDLDQDLLVVGEWMAPVLLINEGGRFTKVELDPPGTGIWWTISKGDFDNDGDDDFLLGNLGWNQKFGGQHPKLLVYAADFDHNGDHDVVLAKKSGDIEFPYRGRECSSEGMPVIATKFPTYRAFAKAPLREIYGEEELEGGMQAEITTLSSVLLRNEGQLRFSSVDLPPKVQTGPVKAFDVEDFDRDGHLDFVYVGNHFPVEVETARYDGLLHGFCYGNGSGNFTVRVFTSPDHPLMGDYRDVFVMDHDEDSGAHLLIVQNDDVALEYYLSAPR